MDSKNNYMEPLALNSVAEFHETFKHPIFGEPVFPTPKRRVLRVELIQSELNELKTAFESEDIVGILDGLADLQYVLSGTVLECGMGGVFGTAFAEVHRSNMSKSCADEAEAQATVDMYAAKTDENRCEAYYELDEKTGRWLVYRSSDNKTLKSVNYSPADLAQFVK